MLYGNNPSFIQALSMANCNIGVSGCKALSRALSTAGNQMTTLTLKCNNLTPKGLQNLCPGLTACKTLTQVELQGTGIGYISSLHALQVEQEAEAELKAIKSFLSPPSQGSELFSASKYVCCQQTAVAII